MFWGQIKKICLKRNLILIKKKTMNEFLILLRKGVPERHYIRRVTGRGWQNLRLLVSDMHLPYPVISLHFLSKYQILSRTLWGSWAQKPFCVFHFFDYRKQASFSIHEFPWVPLSRFKQLLIREGRGCETRGKTLRETIVQPWGKVLLPQ